LEILGVGSLMAQGRCIGYGCLGIVWYGVVTWVESCTVVFLGGHFLLTSSDTFALGCIV